MKLISMLLSCLLSLTFYCISNAKAEARAQYEIWNSQLESVSSEVEKLIPKTTEATTTTTTKATTEPTTKAKKTVTVTATGYCPCYECSGGYGNSTASGKTAKAKHTIAADTSVFPMNTKIKLNGITYVVEDVGSAVKGYHIDIYFDSHQEALDWGKRTVEIEVIK